jgi:hypothetical protein
LTDGVKIRVERRIAKGTVEQPHDVEGSQSVDLLLKMIELHVGDFVSNDSRPLIPVGIHFGQTNSDTHDVPNGDRVRNSAWQSYHVDVIESGLSSDRRDDGVQALQPGAESGIFGANAPASVAKGVQNELLPRVRDLCICAVGAKQEDRGHADHCCYTLHNSTSATGGS